MGDFTAGSWAITDGHAPRMDTNRPGFFTEGNEENEEMNFTGDNRDNETRIARIYTNNEDTNCTN